MVRRLEEISNNAWPALQTMQYDGWILRFAGGVTKRSNSVNMLYPSSLDPDEKISFCENICLAENVAPCFKITAIAQPPDIDARLAARGYAIHSHISFQTMDISGVPAEISDDVHLETVLKPGWMDDFIRMNEFDPTRKSTYMAIMEQLHLPKCFFSLRHDRVATAVGLGVVENSFIGLFDIVVDKACRNAGLGFHIVDNILRWGRKNGAETAYLQVLTDNNAATRLYEKIGFKEAYQYWYRMKAS